MRYPSHVSILRWVFIKKKKYQCSQDINLETILGLKLKEKKSFFYSKASRSAASRSADLGDTLFSIGSQNTWDTLILAKSLEDALFLFFGKKNYAQPFYWI